MRIKCVNTFEVLDQSVWHVSIAIVNILIMTDDGITLLGEKADLQGKELQQALGANPSSNTYLLCDLGQVTAPF